MQDADVRPRPQHAQRTATGPPPERPLLEADEHQQGYPSWSAPRQGATPEPVVVRLVRPGPVVPAELTMDPSNHGASHFYVTPLARGSLRGEDPRGGGGSRGAAKAAARSRKSASRRSSPSAGTAGLAALAIAIPGSSCIFRTIPPSATRPAATPTRAPTRRPLPGKQYKDEKDRERRLEGPKRTTNFHDDTMPSWRTIIG